MIKKRREWRKQSEKTREFFIRCEHLVQFQLFDTHFHWVSRDLYHVDVEYSYRFHGSINNSYKLWYYCAMTWKTALKILEVHALQLLSGEFFCVVVDVYNQRVKMVNIIRNYVKLPLIYCYHDNSLAYIQAAYNFTFNESCYFVCL